MFNRIQLSLHGKLAQRVREATVRELFPIINEHADYSCEDKRHFIMSVEANVCKRNQVRWFWKVIIYYFMIDFSHRQKKILLVGQFFHSVLGKRLDECLNV